MRNNWRVCIVLAAFILAVTANHALAADAIVATVQREANAAQKRFEKAKQRFELAQRNNQRLETIEKALADLKLRVNTLKIAEAAEAGGGKEAVVNEAKKALDATKRKIKNDLKLGFDPDTSDADTVKLALEKAHEDLGDVGRELTTAKEEFQETKDDLLKFVTMAAAYKPEDHKLASRVEALERRTTETECAMGQMRYDIKANADQIASLSRSVESLTATTGKIVGVVRTNMTEIAALKTDLGQLRADVDIRLKGIEARLPNPALLAELSKLRQQLAGVSAAELQKINQTVTVIQQRLDTPSPDLEARMKRLEIVLVGLRLEAQYHRPMYLDQNNRWYYAVHDCCGNTIQWVYPQQ